MKLYKVELDYPNGKGHSEVLGLFKTISRVLSMQKASVYSIKLRRVQ